MDFDPSRDYYKALGVDAKASADDIKKAYRKLAKQFHPDTNGGDKAKEARFKEISSAYDVLGDAGKRAQYDEVRAMGGRVRGGFPPGGPGGGGPGGPFGGSQVWDLGDLFSQMFSGGGGAPRSGPGGRRSVRFERGDDDGGWVFESRQGGGAPTAQPTESRVKASDGSWLTVRGADVFSDVRVPFHHAMLGTVAEVVTLAGSASVKIPPGTSSGRKLRLRGKGVAVDGAGPGDHYVTVQLDVPAELDDKARKLLHELTTHLAQTPGGKRK